jgi:hypothetical protein
MTTSSTDVEYVAEGNSRRFYGWMRQVHSDLDEHIVLLLIGPKHKIKIMITGRPQCIRFLILVSFGVFRYSENN